MIDYYTGQISMLKRFVALLRTFLESSDDTYWVHGVPMDRVREAIQSLLDAIEDYEDLIEIGDDEE